MSLPKYKLYSEKEATKALKELIEGTNLRKQLFSFIHLSFQEYLVAYYLMQQLREGIEGIEKSVAPEETCKFLAQNRDNPKYLMVLKFMAGLISK